jgi:HlyD family secretion protein
MKSPLSPERRLAIAGSGRMAAIPALPWHRVRMARWLLIVAFVLPSFLLNACSARSNAEAATPTPIPTPIIPAKPTYKVQLGNILRQIEFTGRIVPVIQHELYFETSGRVEHVNIKKGDQVTAGQLLAEIKIGASKFDLRRAEIALENARLFYDLDLRDAPSFEVLKAQAQQNLALAQQAVAEAQRAYNRTGATASQASIDAAYAQMLLAKERLVQAQEDYAPYANKPDDNLTKANLRSQLSAAQQAYNRAVAQYNGMTSASDALARTVAETDLLLAQANLVKAEQEWAKWENATPETYVDPELTLKKNELELAQIAFNEMQANVNSARIVSPIDGTVLQLLVFEDTEAEAYKPVIIVANIAQLEISGDLTDQEMSQISEGMSVSIEGVSRPGDSFAGLIRSMPYPYGTAKKDTTSGTASLVRESTRISTDQNLTDLEYEIGDLVHVTVIIEKKDNILWLPPQAIRSFEGRNFVIVQDGEGQRRVDIKVGIKAEDRVEIEEGLAEGQVVIAP